MKKPTDPIGILKAIQSAIDSAPPPKEKKDLELKLAQARWSEHPNRADRMAYASHIRRGHSAVVAMKAAWGTLPR